MSERKVSTDALETLGMIHTREEKRDAIHLAVAPVVASDTLLPNERIHIADGVAYPASFDRPAQGIVDPFLEKAVKQGERFWFVMNPRTVTSLRHVWSHPDFPDEGDIGSGPSASERWIREYAEKIDLAYSTLMEGADAWVASKARGEWGEYLVQGGTLESVYTSDEFWPHYEVVRGVKVIEDHKENFFSCSC